MRRLNKSHASEKPLSTSEPFDWAGRDLRALPDERSPGGRVLEITAAHGAPPWQVALAFLSGQGFVIPKAPDPKHAADNAAGGDLDLSESELARIDAAFPRGPEPASLPLIE